MINIVAGIDAWYERQIKAYPHPNNRASEAGHQCERFLVASRLQPEMKRLHDLGLQRIFYDGVEREEKILSLCKKAGFVIREQQRPFEWKEFHLTGRIDAKVEDGENLIPLEVKGCSPNSFREIEHLPPIELIKSKKPWVRRYPAQILLYMLMDESPEGIILFENKLTIKPIQKEYYLEGEALDYAESILKKLERVNDYVARKELPPASQLEDCTSCGFFGTLCLEQDFGEGFDFIDDEAVEKDLDRIEELTPAKEECNTLYEKIKAMFKGKPTTIIRSKWCIESKKYKRTIFDIPDDIKMKFTKKIECWKTNIKKLKEEH